MRVFLILSVVLMVYLWTAAAVASETVADVTNLYCPVTPARRAVMQYSIEYESQRIYFCCARCRTVFQQDPHRYANVLENMQAQNFEHHTPGGVSQAPRPHLHDHGSGHPLTLLTWAGRFHPAAAHFPVALLIAAALAELLRMACGMIWLRDAARFCVWVGAIGTLVTMPLGWFNAGWETQNDEWILAWHRWLGTFLALWGIALVITLELTVRKNSKCWERYYLGILFTCAVLVAFTGHLGGLLVFGEGYYQW